MANADPIKASDARWQVAKFRDDPARWHFEAALARGRYLGANTATFARRFRLVVAHFLEIRVAPTVHFLACLALILQAATLLADGPATQPAAKVAPIVIDAVPASATLHPGDALKLDVAIKNTSSIDQTINVPNYAWWAHSDDPDVIFPSWPKRAGVGPVVIFKSVTIAPGQTYSHTWQAGISPNAPAGKLVFHLGIPLFKRHWDQLYWSSDIKLKIEAAAK